MSNGLLVQRLLKVTIGIRLITLDRVSTASEVYVGVLNAYYRLDDYSRELKRIITIINSP